MKNNNLNSFRVLPSYYEAICCLDEEDQKEMALAIIKFGVNGKQPSAKIKTTSHLNAIWFLLQPTLESSISYFKSKSLNGKKGGAPIKNTNAKKTTEKQAKNKLKTSENKRESESESEIKEYKEKKNNGIEKSLVDNFPLEEMETYRKTKRLPLKVIETVKEDYILWIQSNPTKKECKNRDMAATIKQWISRDIKSGKIVPKKTDQEMIEELEREYGKIEV